MRLLPERISALLVSELLLSFVCFVVSALLVFGIDGLSPGRLAGIALAAASVVVACFFNGLYRNLQWRSRVALALQLCSVFGMVILLQGLLAYAESPLQVGHWVMLIGAGINFIVMLAWRVAYAALLKKVFATQPILFLGTDDVVCEIAARVTARPELGFSIAGFLSDSHPEGTSIGSLGIVAGRTEDLARIMETLPVQRIVVGSDEMRHQMPVAGLVRAKRQGIVVQEAGSAYELVCGRVCSRSFRPSQIVFANDLAARPGLMAMQSVYSNLVGLALYICALPVLALARLAIRLSSPGPALLTEEYSGMHGIPFIASRLRCSLLDDSSQPTRVGRWIRAMHMEYLPRIGNVVRGEMSLVGPSPVRMEFSGYLSSQIPMYRQRQVVKPGLTGWAQIQNSDGEIADAVREMEADLYYTKYMSVPLDAYILLHTLRGVLPFEEE